MVLISHHRLRVHLHFTYLHDQIASGSQQSQLEMHSRWIKIRLLEPAREVV